MAKKITEVWCYVATEPGGDEGIPAVEMDGLLMPLLAADYDRIVSLRPVAQGVATEMNCTITLYKFGGTRTKVETFRP